MKQHKELQFDSTKQFNSELLESSLELAKIIVNHDENWFYGSIKKEQLYFWSEAQLKKSVIECRLFITKRLVAGCEKNFKAAYLDDNGVLSCPYVSCSGHAFLFFYLEREMRKWKTVEDMQNSLQFFAAVFQYAYSLNSRLV